jgi:hypothetical protein
MIEELSYLHVDFAVSEELVPNRLVERGDQTVLFGVVSRPVALIQAGLEEILGDELTRGFCGGP